MCSGWQRRRRKQSGEMSALGKGQSKFSSFFFIWYDSCHRERKEVFIHDIFGKRFGHLMSDLTGTEKKISSHACLLLSTHWPNAWSQPSQWPHTLVSAKEIAPWVFQHRLRMANKEGGVKLCPIIHAQCCTDVWSHSDECSVFPLYLYFVPPVINCEVLLYKNLHPAPFQMCLTASLGHRRHWLFWRYSRLVDLTHWLLCWSVTRQSQPRMTVSCTLGLRMSSFTFSLDPSVFLFPLPWFFHSLF